jgi:hypothetical protein
LCCGSSLTLSHAASEFLENGIRAWLASVPTTILSFPSENRR